MVKRPKGIGRRESQTEGAELAEESFQPTRQPQTKSKHHYYQKRSNKPKKKKDQTKRKPEATAKSHKWNRNKLIEKENRSQKHK